MIMDFTVEMIRDDNGFPKWLFVHDEDGKIANTPSAIPRSTRMVTKKHDL
jgi:hypothetical protein